MAAFAFPNESPLTSDTFNLPKATHVASVNILFEAYPTVTNLVPTRQFLHSDSQDID